MPEIDIQKNNAVYTTDIKIEALYYVSIGLPIIPLCSATHKGMSVAHMSKCKSPGKVPLISKWTQHTMTTKENIDYWFNQCPYINIGLPLGQVSGIVGLDVDGEQGEVILNAMSGGILPVTWEFTTGNGRRILYKIPQGIKTKKLAITGKGKHEEFSIICDGQQTVMPPSMHHTGRIYKWRKDRGPKDIPLTEAPLWIIEQIKDDNEERKKSEHITEEHWKMKLHEGQRNVELTKRAGSLLGRGVTKKLVLDTLLTFNRNNCEPPLPDEEVATIVESIDLAEKQQQAKSARNKKTDKVQFKPTPFARLFMSEQKAMGYVWKYSTSMGAFYRCDDTLGPWERLDTDFVKSEVRKLLCNEKRGGNPKWDTIHYVNEGVEAIKAELIMPNEDDIFDLGYAVHAKNLDYNPLHIICLNNGVLDWTKDKLSLWSPKIYSTIKLPVDYKPKEDCPYWKRTLKEWIPDEKTIDFLQEYVGLCLIPDTSFRTAVFLYGSGANGKSMFLDTIRLLFGNALVSIPLHRLTNRFETVYLQNKLINICGDIDAKYISDTGVLKTIIGGDVKGIRGEFKHGKSFNFTPVCRMMFSANALPKVSDKTLAWYNRWKFIEFPHTFDVNPAYKISHMKIFEKEISGILNWSLKGLKRLKTTNKWSISEGMTKSAEEYRAENDNVTAFLNEFCIKSMHLGSITTISIPALYGCYNEWISKYLTGTMPVSQVEFTRRIINNGYEKSVRKIEGRSTNAFLGMKIKENYYPTYIGWLRSRNSEGF